MKYRVIDATPEQHPHDLYTPGMHGENLEAVSHVLGVYGEDTHEGLRSTPWLIGSLGLVAVNQQRPDKYKVRLIETRDDGFYSLKEHFWDARVTLGEDYIKGTTKVWPPFRQRLSMRFNVPISAGMFMGYPLLERSAPGMHEKIQETLYDPTLEPAQKHLLPGIYAERPFDLAHRLGVKL